jgi:hypothetical protein
MLPGQLETGRASCLRAPPCRLVFENNVQRVQDTGDETQDGETDVDKQVDTAALLEEDTQRREDDGKDDLANVRSGERHDGGVKSVKTRKRK